MAFKRDLKEALDHYIRERLAAEGVLPREEAEKRRGFASSDFFGALDKYIEHCVAEGIRRGGIRGAL